jgi:2-keto-4-pentenoate hydratase/2-oxohepta-3-ene-1,7-dioic acid hydratase in catechol pathway
LEKEMKIARFKANDATRYGVLEGNHVIEYSGTPFGLFKRGRKKFVLKQVVLLAPTVPSKIVAVGLNYADHAIELKRPVPQEPTFFLKPSTTLVGPGDPIVYPPLATRVHFQAELAVVIKKRCHNAPVERAREYVLGYSCLNDVTARDFQEKGQWMRAKSFDTFCPIGPCIATDIDPHGVTIESYLNGERRQASNTKQFLFSVEEIVSRISQVMTLLPGDVIATGTPAGAGALQPGDRIEVRIEGIGTLMNPVVKIQELTIG